MNDIAGKLPEAERELWRDIDECAGARENQADDEQSTAEIAVQIHEHSLRSDVVVVKGERKSPPR